jgi:hypothetical protein
LTAKQKSGIATNVNASSWTSRPRKARNESVPNVLRAAEPPKVEIFERSSPQNGNKALVKTASSGA